MSAGESNVHIVVAVDSALRAFGSQSHHRCAAIDHNWRYPDGVVWIDTVIVQTAGINLSAGDRNIRTRINAVFFRFYP